ncbi:MAG: hypothetical protein QOF56_434 [Acidobacteriaceae bacterium]|jgi:hypothetical protein|nr:hypothetical protein [Acidobacteriaceae bacterium]
MSRDLKYIGMDVPKEAVVIAAQGCCHLFVDLSLISQWKWARRYRLGGSDHS